MSSELLTRRPPPSRTVAPVNLSARRRDNPSLPGVSRHPSPYVSHSRSKCVHQAPARVARRTRAPPKPVCTWRQPVWLSTPGCAPVRPRPIWKRPVQASMRAHVHRCETTLSVLSILCLSDARARAAPWCCSQSNHQKSNHGSHLLAYGTTFLTGAGASAGNGNGDATASRRPATSNRVPPPRQRARPHRQPRSHTRAPAHPSPVHKTLSPQSI